MGRYINLFTADATIKAISIDELVESRPDLLSRYFPKTKVQEEEDFQIKEVLYQNKRNIKDLFLKLEEAPENTLIEVTHIFKEDFFNRLFG